MPFTTFMSVTSASRGQFTELLLLWTELYLYSGTAVALSFLLPLCLASAMSIRWRYNSVIFIHAWSTDKMFILSFLFAV